MIFAVFFKKILNSSVVEYIIRCFFTPILASFLCLATHIDIHIWNKTNNKQKIEMVDRNKLYAEWGSTDKKVSERKKSLERIYAINDKIKSKLDSIEKRISNYTPLRFKLCEFHAFISRLLGIRLFLEYEIVGLKNGYFVSWEKDNFDPCLNTLEFAEYVKSKGSDFLFVLYPTKNSKYDSQYPEGLIDKSNVTGDKLINKLKIEKINFLDIRENIKNKFKSHCDLFFRTDHHWKPEAGLWAAKEMAEYINKRFNWFLKTELLDKNSFSYTTYPKCFLGSAGKKITLVYGEPDDITIIKPKYDTSFDRICPDWGDARGTFDEVMFEYDHIYKKELFKIYDFYKKNQYAAYFGGDQGYLRLLNKSDYALNKKILLIKDSFNNVVAPFLALMVKDLTMVDVRHFNGSVRSLIANEKYDLVVVAYYGNCVTLKKMFKFE